MTNENKGILQVISESFKKNIRQYTMVIALASIWIVFSIITRDNTFITLNNLSNIFLQSAPTAILAIGMTLVIVTGHIDLSVGAVACFIGAVAGVLQVTFGWPTITVILIALLIGIAIGAWHGFFITYQKVPAFIVTLASMMIFKGLVLVVTGGKSFGPMFPSFKVFGQGYMPAFFTAGTGINDTTVVLTIAAVILFVFFDIRKRLSNISYGFKVLSPGLYTARLAALSLLIIAAGSIMIFNEGKGMPVAILIVLVLTVILSFLAGRTTFGRHLYAIGGNPEAARLSGIPIQKRTMGLFMLMGALTAVAAVVMTARVNSASSDAGKLMELDAIAATVIGGTSLMGGEGSIFGAIIGTLVMVSLDNGMGLMDLSSDLQYIVKGGVLLLAVWIDMMTRKKTA